MTRRRGYFNNREETSKSGENDFQMPVKTYAKSTVKDLLVRNSTEKGHVLEILPKDSKLEVINVLDSKWVQVVTPSGIAGYVGAKNIEIL